MTLKTKLRELLSGGGRGKLGPNTGDKATTQAPTIPGSNTDKVNDLTDAANPDDGEPPRF